PARPVAGEDPRRQAADPTLGGRRPGGFRPPPGSRPPSRSAVRRSRRRGGRSTAVVVGGAAALVVLVVIALRVVSASASGCSGGVGLRVAASPEIAPVLEEVANSWMTAARPQVGGVCVDVTVEAVGSSTVASRLTVYAGRGIDIAAAPE